MCFVDHAPIDLGAPQDLNDAVDHPNVRLFVSHCGCHSTYEALYHGKVGGRGGVGRITINSPPPAV